LADEVAMLVYRVTAGFPKEELFGLTSQIRRAAVSVPSNIVEGCARDSEANYLRSSWKFEARISKSETISKFKFSKCLNAFWI
jgi:four helix bundle protein